MRKRWPLASNVMLLTPGGLSKSELVQRSDLENHISTSPRLKPAAGPLTTLICVALAKGPASWETLLHAQNENLLELNAAPANKHKSLHPWLSSCYRRQWSDVC